MKPDNKLQISSFLPDKKESFINCLQYITHNNDANKNCFFF